MDIVVENGFAYIAEAEIEYQDDLSTVRKGGGLRIIDVVDPTNPAWVGFCDTPGNPTALELAGDYAYVADGRGGLRVIDVTPTGEPAERWHEDTDGTAAGFAMWGNLQFDSAYHFLADGQDGLRIFYGYWHKTYLSYYNEQGQYDTPGWAYDVFAGDYAYVADGGGLRVIDIDNVWSPTETGFCATPGEAVGVVVSATYAYVAASAGGLRVIDVQNAAAPVEVGYLDTAGFAYGIAIRGNHVFLADGSDGLRIVSVADPTNPVEIGSCDTPGTARAVALAGNHAYVADVGGVRVIDIENLAAPAEVAYVDTPGSALDIVTQGRFAYVADGSSGLQVIDIVDPNHPALHSAFDTPGNARSVDVAGYVGVADDWAGVWLIDVAHLLAPVEVGHYGHHRLTRTSRGHGELRPSRFGVWRPAHRRRYDAGVSCSCRFVSAPSDLTVGHIE